MWLIQTISNKFEHFTQRSFDLTHKSEYIQKQLWIKIATHIS